MITIDFGSLVFWLIYILPPIALCFFSIPYILKQNEAKELIPGLILLAVLVILFWPSLAIFAMFYCVKNGLSE